jgi:aspartyl-tRNA(Asn)/glutamyl-tRNA(Gln) amidotransferase subunit C
MSATSAILMEMADLSRDDVLKLAQLTQLDLSEDEVEQFVGEISQILKYVEQLQDVDVSGLQPTSQVTGLTDVKRPDKVINYGYEPADLLKNVPRVEGNQIKVRRVL